MSGYSFESFVVCDRSRVAFSAAAAVTEGRHRGALFLAGPTGSGKTHLLHAISRAIRSRRPDAQILHVPAATLASRVVEAIRVDDLHAFRQSLDKLDALLLDDLYLRPFMLEEILRIAENLSRQGIAVVAAADAAPPRWPGAVVAIGWPGEGARVEIARRTAATHGVVMTDDALSRLASGTTGNPRALQSAIARLAAEAMLARTP